MFHLKIQIIFTLCKTYIKKTMTVITKMYLNISVAFHVLNVFFPSTLNQIAVT